MNGYLLRTFMAKEYQRKNNWLLSSYFLHISTQNETDVHSIQTKTLFPFWRREKDLQNLRTKNWLR